MSRFVDDRLGGGGATGTEREVKELRRAVEGMTDALRSIAKHVIRDGLREVRGERASAEAEEKLKPDDVARAASYSAASQPGILKPTITDDPDYQLECTINHAVSLIAEAQGEMAERLSRHLDALLAEQLKRVNAHE